MRISIAEGKYHAALRHITCAFGANIDLLIIPSSTVAATTVPLLHKARQSRAGEGWRFSTYHLRRRRKYRARGARIFIKNPLSLVLYARISIAACGKYRAALRHITCAVGANIERAERAYPKGGRKEKCLSFSCRSFFAPFFMFAVCDKRKIRADSFRG